MVTRKKVFFLFSSDQVQFQVDVVATWMKHNGCLKLTDDYEGTVAKSLFGDMIV